MFVVFLTVGSVFLASLTVRLVVNLLAVRFMLIYNGSSRGDVETDPVFFVRSLAFNMLATIPIACENSRRSSLLRQEGRLRLSGRNSILMT